VVASRIFYWIRIAVLAAGATGFWIAPSAFAMKSASDLIAAPPVRTVTKLADTNDGACDADCSLREAIALSLSEGIIDFAKDLTGTITLNSTLIIKKNVTINGPLAMPIIISGNHALRVFYVNSGVHFTISNLTIANGQIRGESGSQSKSFRPNLNGQTIGGGGLLNNDGVVTIMNSTFYGNKAIGGNGAKNFFGKGGAGGNGLGGALFSTGTLYLINSTFSDNKAAGGIGADIVSTINSTISGDGGDGLGGAIYATRITWVSNCTFSGNGAFGGAGGTANSYDLSNGKAGIGSGGAIYRPGALPDKNTLAINRSGIVTIKNSLITNSQSGGNCEASIKSEGYNIDSDGTCRLKAAGDLSNINPRLDSLKSNDGPTLTHALLPGSPAIDAGNPAGCTDPNGIALPTDQRGHNRINGTACDIGSFEAARQ
jgi:CSLREA domain-containing protein